MRVTHVVEAATGGVARYLLDWIHSSRDLDLQQHLVYSEFRVDGLMEAALELAAETGWQLSILPMRREISLADDFNALRTLRDKLKHEPVADVVHLHSSKAGALGRVALSFDRSTRVVYSPHALATDSQLHRMVETGLSNPLMVDAYASITSSETKQINATVNRFSRRPVFVVAPAMTHISSIATIEKRRDSETPLIVGCGRMVGQKDPHEFVRVLAAVRDKGLDVVGRWVGDGPDRESVRQLAVSLGVDSEFSVSGWVDDPLVELANADIFLSTSRFESFGYVTAESMALGTPAVATAVPGTLSLAGENDENCLTFDVGDTSEASALLARVIQSPVETRQRTERANQFVRKTFTTAEMAKAMMAAYGAPLTGRPDQT